MHGRAALPRVGLSPFIQPFIQRYTNDYRTLLYVPDDNRGFASRSSNAGATGVSLSQPAEERIGERQPPLPALRGNDSNPEEESQSEKARRWRTRTRTRSRARARAARVSRRNCSHVHYETRAFPRCRIVRDATRRYRDEKGISPVPQLRDLGTETVVFVTRFAARYRR